ncbi:MAG: double-strand break repair helicase AddA [Rhodobacteraceae bacterium]|nr:double-strand break repair helicase AddA [Paracoccaceae bacterium]
MRFNEATRPQVEAADPGGASWVSANAGSGKTRVLTNRVARLLLAGVPPQRILCLTFTNAAASNMQIRLFELLGEWSMLPDHQLQEKLLDLGEPEAGLDSAKLANSRTLFARALETPGGLKIQTIHAFSAALLRRFPYEAGVSPQFQSLDERAERRLQLEILDELAESNAATYNAVSRHVSIDALPAFLEAISHARESFLPQRSKTQLFGLFGLPADADAEPQNRIMRLFTAEDAAMLATLAERMAESASPTDRAAAEKLATIDAAQAGPHDFTMLVSVFLTGASAREPYSPKSSPPTKAVQERLSSDGLAWLESYRHRVAETQAVMLNLRAAEKTVLLHQFAAAYLDSYEERKRSRALLDFDDLILLALKLLKDHSSAQWVLFRLDGGIDHVLIDEAQDVSPNQWHLVQEISREFTTGRGARDTVRTVFAVGDEKQSIYGFQGAAPERFAQMRDYFRQSYSDAAVRFRENSLNYSFRSAGTILQLVDKVFESCGAPGFTHDLRHEAFKSQLPGRIDLWPFLEKTADNDGHDWTDPHPLAFDLNSHVKLARSIAHRVERMLRTPESLPGDEIARPVRPGDILILVRRRSDLFYAIIREIKALGLPIAGADRLALVEELAIRDITALLAFLAFPKDDLSLAAVLRSPLFALSEDELFDLAHGRAKSLWSSLHAAREKFADPVTVLEDLLSQAETSAPYELIERILINHGGRQKFTARLGGEVEETMDMLLLQALEYEREESVSLVGFLDWLAGETEVKRQLDQAGDEIRVMTIHGAKGLESPIVILPDTEHRKMRQLNPIVETEDGTPVWSTRKDEEPPLIRGLRNREERLWQNEELRLLYVALTRAESWLIICGEGQLKEEAWHGMIRSALSKIDAQPFDYSSECGDFFAGMDGLRLISEDWPESAEHDQVNPVGAEIPAWALQPALVSKAEPERFLSPSNLGGEKSAPDQDAASDSAAKIGTRLHLLLEHLPELPVADRESAANALLNLNEPGIDGSACDEAFRAASQLLAMPDLEYLFAADSVAEAGIVVPLPTLDDEVAFGYIDRLLIEEDRVLAVDYKSNQRVPAQAEDIPEAILRQLAAYREMLSTLYPDRRIEVAVLWTRTAELMHVPAAICDAALGRAALD